MKKQTIAIYPGSFNPFHEGHKEIVEKALLCFDKVIVAKGINPNKNEAIQEGNIEIPEKAIFIQFTSLLSEFCNKNNATCIVKGLRNGIDMENEMTQQEWNRQLGLTIPTFYIISNPEHRHISSSAIRTLNLFRSKDK